MQRRTNESFCSHLVDFSRAEGRLEVLGLAQDKLIASKRQHGCHDIEDMVLMNVAATKVYWQDMPGEDVIRTQLTPDYNFIEFTINDDLLSRDIRSFLIDSYIGFSPHQHESPTQDVKEAIADHQRANGVRSVMEVLGRHYTKTNGVEGRVGRIDAWKTAAACMADLEATLEGCHFDLMALAYLSEFVAVAGTARREELSLSFGLHFEEMAGLGVSGTARSYINDCITAYQESRKAAGKRAVPYRKPLGDREESAIVQRTPTQSAPKQVPVQRTPLSLNTSAGNMIIGGWPTSDCESTPKKRPRSAISGSATITDVQNSTQPAARKAKKSKTDNTPSGISNAPIDEAVAGEYLDGDDDGSVPVYATCDAVRRNITAFLNAGSGTQAALCRAIAAQLPHGAKMTSVQLQRFRTLKGARAGSSSNAFYGAYVALEKLRIGNGKPKSAFRMEMEMQWPGGFPRDGEKKYWSGPANALSEDKYGKLRR